MHEGIIKIYDNKYLEATWIGLTFKFGSNKPGVQINGLCF